MRKLPYLLLLAWLLLITGSLSFGQTPEAARISGNFTGLSFEQFVREIEAQTDYRFYFDPKATDSLRVTMQAQAQPLPAILNQLFRGSDYHYVITSGRQVFVTRGRQVLAELPTDFFDQGDGRAGELDALADNYLSDRETKKNEEEIKLYEIGQRINAAQSGNANLAGTVRDARSGEPVVGAAIYCENPWVVTVTNQFGYYSINLPRGRHTLNIRIIGMKDTKRQVVMYSDGKLDVEMYEDVIPLKEVVIEAGKDVNVSGLQMGLERLDIRTIRQVPTAFGEADMLRVVLTLPGVKSVGESSTGLNVRGGATDQNLILFNDATIYNPSHLFGFFSAFNPDALKNVELYKGNIPAKHGGRLSSVLDITTREGNKKKFSGVGGIGLLTGRLTLEGPIIKDKSSFLIGGRSSYSNWLLRRLPDPNLRRSEAGFYDVNAHISHEIDEKNSIYATGYLSRDRFRLGLDTLFGYSNRAASIKWNHIFRNNLYGVFTGGYSGYQFSVRNDRNPLNAAEQGYQLSHNVKADFSYFPLPQHSFDFGISSILYRMAPGQRQPLGAESLIRPEVIQPEQGLETALYISDRYDVNSQLSISVGLRYSFFQYLGPRDVLTYPLGQSRETFNVQDTVRYRPGQVIRNYGGPEYRLSARYSLSPKASVKASYNRTRQYLHMLTNTTMISPTDIWKLSDSYIRPQVGDQYSVGIFRNLKSNTIEFSAEAYYRTMNNVLDFRSGAVLFMNPQIETDVMNVEGKAYGVELMLKKLTGKLNGWLSYTYSRSLLRTSDPETPEVYNRGEYYPSNFDQPHDITFVGNYKFNRRFSFSLNFTHSTGRPITLPLAKYELGGSKRVFYSERNQYRIPDYYRVDFSMNIEGNHKIKKLAHSYWTLAVYNLTGRKNPYSIFFVTEGNAIKGYQLAVFGQPIPTITYNFKF
jgi:hypothetical protein